MKNKLYFLFLLIDLVYYAVLLFIKNLFKINILKLYKILI